MGATIIGRAALCAGALLLAACAAFTPGNPPLAKYDPDAGYRFDRLQHAPDADRLFVIVSFSGGGTRAAALSYGVLEALRDTMVTWQGRRVSLLAELDVVSSISGGSFPAAYYALRGEKIFDEFPDKFLYRKVQDDLAKLLLNPANLLKLTGTGFGTSDLAAEFYNREVFGGGTYADVIALNRRPFVVLNATDMTTGYQFPFIQDQFDLLCSDLAGVPLARAAASSSAFPVGLSPLTFQNYAGGCGYRQPRWVELAANDHASRVNRARTALAENRLSLAATGPAGPKRPYIHMTDGGVADNIGMRGPLDSITSINSPYSVLRMVNNQLIDKLVVIVVNAATNPTTDRDQTPKIPGILDTFATAAGVPLDNFTADTLDLVTAAANEFSTDWKIVADCKKVAASQQCTLNIPAPHKVDFYPVQVAFDYIVSAEERNWFKNIPTSFELPRETIDRLRAVGRKLLAEDPKFQALMKDLRGCLPQDERPC